VERAVLVELLTTPQPPPLEVDPLAYDTGLEL